MACSCKTAKSAQRGVVEPVAEIPHEVLPNESCIFCADKHVSTAYTMLLSGEPLYSIVGELELARRHTLLEFSNVSENVAQVEYAAILNDEETVRAVFPLLLQITEETAMQNDPNKRTEVNSYTLETTDEIVHNPFIGFLHFTAAWRLAFEVGYMMPNRSMIIGDLDLAREHLVRFDYGLNTTLRELRHRVQTTRAADLNIYWPYTAQSIAKWINSNMNEYKERYANALAKRLQINERQPDNAMR